MKEFHSRRTFQILRGSLDGTSLKKVVAKDGISELAIDRRHKRIYWSTLAHIESSNYEGGDRRVVTPIFNSITNLTVADNQLFWVTAPNGMNRKPILWTCNVTVAGICGNYLTHFL